MDAVERERNNEMINATKWNVRARSRGLALALTVGVTCPVSLGAAEAESFPADSPRWQLGLKAKITDYLGRRCLALEDDVVTLKDFEMTDGVIDLDMAGTGARGFYNIFFRTQANGDGESVYLRPHKTGLDDAQQYSPLFQSAGAWQIYNGPGFTAAVDIPRDVWFHVRLVIAGAQAKLYISGMAEPSLVMNDLKSGMRNGGVGFTGVHVSNVEIRRMSPAVWEHHEPAMPPTTITRWSLSPSMLAQEHDPGAPIVEIGSTRHEVAGGRGPNRRASSSSVVTGKLPR